MVVNRMERGTAVESNGGEVVDGPDSCPKTLCKVLAPSEAQSPTTGPICQYYRVCSIEGHALMTAPGDNIPALPSLKGNTRESAVSLDSWGMLGFPC